jgi:ribosomal protein L33
MAISQQLHERIKAFAAELRREVYGVSGAPQWGTRFTEIEEVGVEIGDAVACAMVSQSLQGQVPRADGAAALACTACGRQSQEDEVEPRLVRMRRGETPWLEPKGYCKHCRKAFFPSVESLGNRTG